MEVIVQVLRAIQSTFKVDKYTMAMQYHLNTAWTTDVETNGSLLNGLLELSRLDLTLLTGQKEDGGKPSEDLKSCSSDFV